MKSHNGVLIVLVAGVRMVASFTECNRWISLGNVFTRASLFEGQQRIAPLASSTVGGPDGSSAPASYIMSTIERARTVAAACTSGTLCTSCKNQEGAPFGSHVDYILDAQGCPVLLLSEQALHTANIRVRIGSHDKAHAGR